MYIIEKLQSKLKSNNFVVWSLIIIGSIIYVNSLGGKLFWDAEYEILQNAHIKDWSFFPNYFVENLGAGAGRGGEYWRPMLLILYSLEWHMWNGWEVGYHFINTAFHITNSILLFFLAKRLLKTSFSSSSLSLISCLLSLIFLVHPLQTESVTYITGIADPFATFWIFLSLLFYLKKNIKLSILFFVFSLMTKETSIIFPGILLMADHVTLEWHKNLLQTVKRLLMHTWPYFLISSIYLLLRMTVLNFGNFLNLYNDSNPYTDSIIVRFYTFAKTLPIYLKLLVFPQNLHPERVLRWESSPIDIQVFTGLLIFIILIAIIVFCFKKRPEYSFASTLILLPLFPASGIIFPANALIYEHWLYIPLIGFFLTIGLAIRDLVARFKFFQSKIPLFFALCSLFIYLLFLSISTISRNYTYGDPERFYNDILKYNQTSLRVWNNLGMLYADRADWNASANAYNKAISLDPKDQSWPPHHNLGNTYKNEGKIDLAITEFNRAIQIDKGAYQSYLALTQIYLEQKDYVDATATLNRAIEAFPQDIQLRQYLDLVQQEAIKK